MEGFSQGDRPADQSVGARWSVWPVRGEVQGSAHTLGSGPSRRAE